MDNNKKDNKRNKKISADTIIHQPLVYEPDQEGITVSVRQDYFFKKVFGQEDSKHAAAKLIHLTTGIPLQDMVGLEYLSPFLRAHSPSSKKGIVDILLKLEDGRKIHIEMQNHWQNFYPRRIIYYWSKIYGQDLGEGQSYSNLQPVIGIHFIHEGLPQRTPLLEAFKLKSTSRDKILDEVMQLHFINLEKLAKLDSRERLSELKGFGGHNCNHVCNHSCTNELMRWLLFIRTESQYIRDKLAKGDQLMTECNEKIKSVYKDKEEQLQYLRDLAYLMASCDEASYREEAKKKGLAEGRAEGLAEGRAEGLAEGRAEGLAEGRAKGLAEGRANAAKELARKLLARGTDTATVSELTGLSLEVLNNLK